MSQMSDYAGEISVLDRGDNSPNNISIFLPPPCSRVEAAEKMETRKRQHGSLALFSGPVSSIVK
jgi:hypothetical protein